MNSTMTHRTLAFAIALLALCVAPISYAQKAALVSDVDNGARQPVQLVASLSFASFGGVNGEARNFSDGTPFTVPTGKRLVIEYLSGEARLAAGVGQTADRFGVSYVVPPPSFAELVLVRVPFVFTGTSGAVLPNDTDQYVGGQLVRAYFDAGSKVTVVCLRNNGSAVLNPTCRVTVVGYLVNLP